jgi:hypothetical protein
MDTWVDEQEVVLSCELVMRGYGKEDSLKTTCLEMINLEEIGL